MSAPSVPNSLAPPPPPLLASGDDPSAPPPALPSPPTAAPEAASLSEPDADDQQQETPNRRRTLRRLFDDFVGGANLAAWLTSAAVHCAIVLILALLVFSPAGLGPDLSLEGFFDSEAIDEADLAFDASPAADLAEELPAGESGPQLAMLDDPTTAAPIVAAPVLVESTAPTGLAAAGPVVVSTEPLAFHGGGLDGRSPSNRHGLALAGGGTDASEAAVEAGLAWLAEHQYPDGSWRFDLEHCPRCAGYCGNSGTNLSSTAATGLALLSFLGAGYTHRDGKYAETVQRGLYYLTEVMAVTSHGGDLRDLRVRDAMALQAAPVPLRAKVDTMYSHGIATLALTEAYAMTYDTGLKDPATEAVKFIINGQNPDGGWRYTPSFETPTAGDVTVTGWQVMALKSGALAGIPIPYEVWRKLSGFLDENAVNEGSEYGYVMAERGTRATSAIGLLCRMFEGWGPDHRPLQRGVANLSAQKPEDNHMYYNYYATLVLHHYGRSDWRRWNPKMREYLVKSQSTRDHEAGSWYFEEGYSRDGGRLYTTALSILTLEVYYRYLPLYQEGSDQ